jgi:RNA polymerase sigma-70 factor (ECF subfamily)
MPRGVNTGEPVPDDVSALRNRAHFLAVYAQAMRRVPVDLARRHNAKRGAGVDGVSLDAETVLCVDRTADFMFLDELTALAERTPRKAKVVELRLFGGLSVEETAEVLRVSPITVLPEWKSAKAWLDRELTGRLST